MRIFLLCCLSVLAACSIPGRRDAAPLAIYDLGPPASRQPVAGGLPAFVLEVKAPNWLDTPGIEYRLAYAEPGRVRHYAEARWAAAPAALIQQRLVQQLGLMPAGQGRSACVLRVELDQFGQVFQAPGDSHGVLQARLALLDQGRNRVAEQLVSIRKAAASQDSRGGVMALTEAVAQLGSDIDRWQRELPDSQLRTCGNRAA